MKIHTFLIQIHPGAQNDPVRASKGVKRLWNQDLSAILGSKMGSKIDQKSIKTGTKKRCFFGCPPGSAFLQFWSVLGAKMEPKMVQNGLRNGTNVRKPRASKKHRFRDGKRWTRVSEMHVFKNAAKSVEP